MCEEQGKTKRKFLKQRQQVVLLPYCYGGEAVLSVGSEPLQVPETGTIVRIKDGKR
jgi:hypothetical protein